MSKIRPIDATALKETIIEWFNLTEVHDQYWWNRVKAIIDNAPTVDSERQDGTWIVTYHKSLLGTWNGWYGYKCSACKKIFVEGRDIYESAKFCPNCGATIVGTKHLKDKVE